MLLPQRSTPIFILMLALTIWKRLWTDSLSFLYAHCFLQVQHLEKSMLLTQLTKLVSSRDHPFYKFETGNLDTLDIGPKSRGVDTCTELVKFYTANYSSNLMRLVVYGRDELTVLVQNKFSLVNNTGRKAKKFTGQPCLPEHLQILVVPVREGHNLKMMFPITPEIKTIRQLHRAIMTGRYLPSWSQCFTPEEAEEMVRVQDHKKPVSSSFSLFCSSIPCSLHSDQYESSRKKTMRSSKPIDEYLCNVKKKGRWRTLKIYTFNI